MMRTISETLSNKPNSDNKQPTMPSLSPQFSQQEFLNLGFLSTLNLGLGIKYGIMATNFELKIYLSKV